LRVQNGKIIESEHQPVRDEGSGEEVRGRPRLKVHLIIEQWVVRGRWPWGKRDLRAATTENNNKFKYQSKINLLNYFGNNELYRSSLYI